MLWMVHILLIFGILCKHSVNKDYNYAATRIQASNMTFKASSQPCSFQNEYFHSKSYINLTYILKKEVTELVIMRSITSSITEPHRKVRKRGDKGKIVLFNTVLGKTDIHIQKNEIDPYFISYSKINSKRISRSKVTNLKLQNYRGKAFDIDLKWTDTHQEHRQH